MAGPWPLRPSVQACPPYVSSYAPQFADEIKLNHNEAADDVSADFKAKALQMLAERPWHRYADSDASELRAAIAQTTGHPADGIAVGHGANDVLTRLLWLFAPDTRVVLAAPDYYLYARMARVAGLAVHSVPLRRDGVQFALEGDAILAAAAGPSVLILSQPNNPTGQLFDAGAVLHLAQNFAGAVVIDEAYCPYADSSLLPHLPALPHVLLLRTLSKAHALAGVRVGYVLGSPELAGQFGKLQPPYPIGVLESAAAALAMQDATGVAERVRQTLSERHRLQTALAQLGVPFTPSATNFVLMHLGERRTAVLRALADAHLAVRDVDKELPGCVRVSVGAPAANDRALAAIAAGWRA